MESQLINQEVYVTGVYLEGQDEIETYPKRMEFAGQTYTFLRGGINYLVDQGQKVVKVFKVSDGDAQYSLRQDDDCSQWTLLEITPNY